jgi:transcriptional regulator with XRE-family HTH domain
MDSVQFLDAVRAKHGIPSDRKLARFLGVAQGRMSLYRTGTRKLDPDACLKVAKALELPPEHVFASVQAERAKRTEHRRVWERLAKIAKNAGAAAVVGFIASTSTPTTSNAAGADAESLYILLNRRRWWLPVLVDRRAAPIPARLERRHQDRRRSGRRSQTVRAVA